MLKLLYIGVAIGSIGMVLLVASNAMYYMRTKDKINIKRIWLSKDILSKNEYILNRTGFVLTYGMLALISIMLISKNNNYI